jgi:hypothetical protein
MKKSLLKLINDKKGSEFTEIATVLAVIVVGGILAYSLLGDKIVALINQVAGSI